MFLNAFRGGGGGLEHLNSSLLSSAASPQSPAPTLRWLKFVSHEFFHAINVKRLRPIELGPFDYTKGCVVGCLLDARIRRVTNGRRTLDDAMRLAYRRYGGARGFKPEEFQATASEVAGANLSDLFRRMLATTEELDYTEMLNWYGLRFTTVDPSDAAASWTLEVRPDATAAQRAHLDRLLAPSRLK